MEYRYGSHTVYQTVGQMTEEMIRQYLEHQFEPNIGDNFQMEPE